MNVTQVQLDELWNFIARKQAIQAASDGESTDESADGRQWVWASFAPEFSPAARRLGRPPHVEKRPALDSDDGRCRLWYALFLQ